jgi:hypothetical protein
MVSAFIETYFSAWFYEIKEMSQQNTAFFTSLDARVSQAKCQALRKVPGT